MNRRITFVAIKFFILMMMLCSCSMMSSSGSDTLSNDLISASAKLAMVDFFQSHAPVLPPQKSRFQKLSKLPGNTFKPNLKLRIAYDESGSLILEPGDYLIPVMTYCMDSNSQSPSGHIYTLSQLRGARAQAIRSLNLRALPKFSYHDVQILSWSLQNGLKYEDFTIESKKIVDSILPDFKELLKESFFESLEKKWNEKAEISNGLIPSFSDISDETLESIGDAGRSIREIRRFRNTLKKVGNNYEALSQRIGVTKQSGLNSGNTSWSQISENVYARFVTKGSFQELGQIEVRVARINSQRSVNAETVKTKVDLTSWLADPMIAGVQPLSFSPVYGYGGVLVIPALAEAPLLAAAVLGAVLAAETIDWEAFHKLHQLLRNVKSNEVQNKIKEGLQVLSKKHDELEKPLRDKGIINDKTRNTTKNKDGSTREYTNPGGQEALDKDFDKLDGSSKKTDGVEVKDVDQGIKAVKRPATDEQNPTIEMQPQRSGNRIEDSTRVKVRYE